MMKKKSFALAAVAAACATSFAFATPQTQFEQGQWQLDLGAWNPKAEADASNWVAGGSNVSTDAKWNFQGGLTYGLSDKWGLEYAYHGLKTKGTAETTGIGTNGDEHEINLVYSLNKNFALYGGWNRIKNSFENTNYSQANNVAQLGLIAKAPLSENFDIYGKAAVGTQRTTLWEAGLGYTMSKDFDLSAGYRYVNTKLADKGEAGLIDDANISYKGPFVTLSYRFGGGHEVAPEPVYVAPEPTPAPVVTETPHVYNDYYLDSIHFDFDQDQPMASEQAKLDNFVAVAKSHPNDTFKLVGNTDSKGTDGYNDDLSKRRMTNVAQYAVNNGVNSAQLQLNYKGENDPVSTNNTDQGRADNRRVDIWQHK